jgi:hypothetical protein
MADYVSLDLETIVSPRILRATHLFRAAEADCVCQDDQPLGGLESGPVLLFHGGREQPFRHLLFDLGRDGFRIRHKAQHVRQWHTLPGHREFAVLPNDRR